MDLNLYRIFLEVAKTGSISKAASSLFVSQPSISYSIKMLEEELKCKLFNRTAKGTELTIDGEKLLFYVEGAFNMINAGCKTVKDSENMISGEIRVGVPTHIGIFLLSKYIQKFIEKYPGIKFTIVNRATSEMVDMLEKRNLDFIVDSYPIDSNRKDIVLYKLIEVSNCFVGNEKYKNIVNEGIINIEDIQKYPLLLPPKITSTRKALESKLKDRIDNLEAIIDVPTTEVMLELVKKGLGIGYFTKESVQKYIDSGRLYEIPVDVELPKTDICIAYVDNFLANAPKKFIEMLNSEIKSVSYTKEKSLRLILTQECTYNCSMCHKEGIHSKKENLLTNEDFAYIYEIANKEYGINKVNLTGGDPLLRDDIQDLLIKLKQKNAKITMTTNGYLLDKNIEIGNLLNKLNISVHSLNKEKFEELCGKKDSFEKVINNIKMFRAQYPTLNIGINTTIIKGINSDEKEIEELIEMAGLLKVELKFIELYPKNAKEFVPIHTLEPILKNRKTRHFKLCLVFLI
ncbi:MAG TPA: LysR substrate-binding domain-containing protein [Clostridiaceae bacterium]|jgi:transcriptional regulator, LysR family|nr:LysR substrate-binding domain-containing protein [Clostridiaceae bacterium]